MRGESPSSLEHPSWPQAEKQPPCPFSTPSGRGKAAARDDSCADLSARCRGLGECGLPGAARGGCSDIGYRRALAATHICRGRSAARSRRSSARSSDGFRSPLGRRETPHVQPEAIIVGRPPRNTAYAVAFGAARRPVDTLPPCRRATQGCAPAARVPETTPVGAQLARGNKAVGRRALKVTLPPPHLRFTAIASQWRGAL